MSVARQRQMKLFAFLWNQGAHAAGWRHPLATDVGQHKLSFFQALAHTAERGKFDAVFFADSVGFHRTRGRDAFARVDHVRLEPLTLLAALAATTTHIGLVATASASFNQPYTLARFFASLDHISNGRIGWNIVTSTGENEAHNFGLDKNYGHSERYERATEFVEVVQKLWDSWEDGALVMDKASGRYSDPDKIHALHHEGRFLKVEGPLNIARPPQGHPVLVQAGSSDTGRRFAARFAETIFTSHPGIDSAREFYADVRRQVVAAGRDVDSIKILTSVQPVVGATEEEAQRIARELNDLVHPDLAISMLGAFLGGIDLSSEDPDGPLPDIPETENARSTRARVLDWAAKEKLSVRQIADRIAAERTSRSLVGTPEQIADGLQDWFDNGASDGFIVAPAFLPGGLDRFVDEVVPVLQKRGLFRTEYEGTTLRENLGLPRPANHFAEHPEDHFEPEIW